MKELKSGTVENKTIKGIRLIEDKLPKHYKVMFFVDNIQCESTTIHTLEVYAKIFNTEVKELKEIITK